MTTLFLCGDVMTGRGVDQILAHSNAPGIQEPYVQDARDYVALAEEANGPISRPVSPAYMWGEALEELDRVAPDARIINLETSITTSDEFWPGKGIHYRMHPNNVDCFTAARIDVCVLANNHVLDYGHSGLEETIRAHTAARLKLAGAGSNIDRARQPAMLDLAGGHRILVFSIGSETSGIPRSWAASANSSGVDLLPDLSDATADDVLNRLRCAKRRGDMAIVSVHWGSNWGYEVPPSHVRFAHRLLDGEVDLIHGHSSHHPRPIEIYNDQLVLYGCGDFMDDYEGISGYEEFRDDLVLMYFPTVDSETGELLVLKMTPLRIRKMQLIRASAAESEWLRDRMALVSRDFGCDVDLDPKGALMLRRRVASCA
jgi:poly-gamma-glutamate capsule biosynthesis protein CapA/YwtB (metallophosphatase superfamily)